MKLSLTTFFVGSTSVWILGSSIIKHAWLHSKNRPGGTNLGLERIGVNLIWQGYSGMKLCQLKRRVRNLLKFVDPPSYIVIHCGGNDIGEFPILEIRRLARSAIEFLNQILPNTVIIWSQILPRSNWRYSTDCTAMDTARIRLNNSAATQCIHLGGSYIKYPDLKVVKHALWSSDGVHLSKLGNEIFLNGIQGGLESIISYGVTYYPH